MPVFKLFIIAVMFALMFTNCARNNDVNLHSNLLSISDLINVHVTNEQDSRNTTVSGVANASKARVRDPEFFTD